MPPVRFPLWSKRSISRSEPREQLEQVPRLGRYQDQRAGDAPRELEVRPALLVPVRQVVQDGSLALGDVRWGEVAQRGVVLVDLLVDASEQASNIPDQVVDATVHDDFVRPKGLRDRERRAPIVGFGGLPTRAVLEEQDAAVQD